jgi:hypothetical protein
MYNSGSELSIFQVCGRRGKDMAMKTMLVLSACLICSALLARESERQYFLRAEMIIYVIPSTHRRT